MAKQALFLHGAGPQGPNEGSGPFARWLKENLSPQYNVLCPIMPSPEEPDYAPWKSGLDAALRDISGDVILIGHSLGGSVLLKYLSEETLRARVTAVFCVAAPFWGGDKDWHYEAFTLSGDFAERLPARAQFWFYHAKGDPIVPFGHVLLYAERLPQATIRTLDGDDHIFADGLPALADDILSLN